MRPWWMRPKTEGEDPNGGGHANPDLERESARVLGRLEEACDRLARLVSEVNTVTGELDMAEVQEQARRASRD